MAKRLRAACWLTLALTFAGCSLARSITWNRLPSSHGASAPTGAGAAAPVAEATTASATEREWARRALAVLGTVDTAVREYHDATALPSGSVRRRQLQDGAFADFRQAVADHQALWPMTQQIDDTDTRDQFVFVMGNVSGFLNPTPDLPADPPSLGDRIGRSLENAIAASASVRPRLEKLAAQQ